MLSAEIHDQGVILLKLKQCVEDVRVGIFRLAELELRTSLKAYNASLDEFTGSNRLKVIENHSIGPLNVGQSFLLCAKLYPQDALTLTISLFTVSCELWKFYS